MQYCTLKIFTHTTLCKCGMLQHGVCISAKSWNVSKLLHKSSCYVAKNLHYAYPTLCYMDNQVLSQNMGTFSGTKLSMMTIASVLNVVQPTIVIYLSHWASIYHSLYHDRNDAKCPAVCLDIHLHAKPQRKTHLRYLDITVIIYHHKI